MKLILDRNVMHTRYDSFMFLEGQCGLPRDIQEIQEFVQSIGIEHWVIENLFTNMDRIRAIPYLKPDVLVFETTLQSKREINAIIEYLQKADYKPKEIWQLTPDDIPIVDTLTYDIYSPYIGTDNRITLRKIQ